MTNREKTLATAVAAAGVLWFGNQGISSYRTSVEQSENQQIAAEQELSEARAALLRGERARKQLNLWRKQSLPTNAQVAESKYYDWLRSLLEESGLVVQGLSDNKSQGYAREQFTPLTFDVDAQGSLENVTKFLYRFYAAPHLHRISSATLAPTDSRKNVSVNLTVDALILTDCRREDELASEGATTEPERELDEVSRSIVSRNIFVPYSPQVGAAASIAKDWDEEAAKQVKISGVMGGGDGWLLSVMYTQQDNQVKYFRQGDSIEIGSMNLTILHLDGQRILLQCKDGRREVRLGQTFDQAVKTDDSAAAAVDDAIETASGSS